MALPRHFFAPSFRHRHLGAFLAVIVGVMVYMAAFVMAAEASLSTITLTWNRDLQSRLTVELPAVDDEASVPQAERVRQAVSILQAMHGIVRVTPVPDTEASRLLEPWIIDPEILKALPVPALIDIERVPGSTVTADDVHQQLKATLRDVRVDDHAAWLIDLERFVNGLAAFGGLMIVLTVLTLVLAVSLVCRTIMATEQETISLLHIMGAEDSDIARHFENHACRLSLAAAGIGFALAMGSAGALLYFMRHFADPGVLRQAHWMILGGATLAVPLAAVWIAALSARFSVLNFLRSMP